VAVIPSAFEAAALVRLGMLRSDDLPMLAAHLLINVDAPALRRVAGLDKSDGWLIDQVWPEAMGELGVPDLSPEEAWDLAMTYQIASWRAGEKSTVEVIRTVVRFYIDNDYPRWAPEAGSLYGFEDELDGGWGRKPDEVLAEAGETLNELDHRIRARS
jgi:hypothetical protein